MRLAAPNRKGSVACAIAALLPLSRAVSRRWAIAFGAAACLAAPAFSPADPFYMGGDVSLLPFIESRGGTFRDGGVIKPADRILVERGANLFRVRLFVNPNPNYNATLGAIQDLPYAIALTQRLKASGAKVLLDFHYSDTWADPGQQAKPAAWTSLNDDALKARVREYTRDSLLAFDAAGAMPDLVQVGNEVTNGMLYSSGQVLYSGSTATQNQSWRNFGGLLNSAIAGVRDVDAQLGHGRRTPVAIHVDGGTVQGRAQYFFGQLKNVAGVDPTSYDIAGLSFYPTATAALANLQGNLAYVAQITPLDVMVLEANAPWKGSATGAVWPSTAAGQREFLLAVRDAVRAAPNGRGRGVLWWYPEAIQAPGTNIWRGGAIALFDDSGGDALPALDALLLPAPTWSASAGGLWSQPAHWSGGLPSGVGQEARFGPLAGAGRTIELDTPRTLGTLRFAAAESYRIAGASNLTLDNPGDGPTRIDALIGHHAIAAPVTSLDDLEINAAWTSSLTLSGELRAAGATVTKVGSGVLKIYSIDAAHVEVQFGTMQLLSSSDPGAAPPLAARVGSLHIAANAHLDLSDAALVIDSATSPPGDALTALRRQIIAGRITSSAADAAHAIGYGDNAVLKLGTFVGRELDADAIVLRVTLRGDANLDGTVNFADLLSLARHYGQTAVHWTDGDFDRDGTTGFADLLALARNYEQSIGGMSFPADAAGAWVPEPVTAGVLMAALASLLRRARRL